MYDFLETSQWARLFVRSRLVGQLVGWSVIISQKGAREVLVVHHFRIVYENLYKEGLQTNR